MNRPFRLGVLWLAAGLALPLHAAKPVDTEPRRAALEQAEQALREAREQLLRSAREVARLRGELGEDAPLARALSLMVDPRRAALGVSVAPGPLEQGRQRGVRITGVTPGSGAEQAGLRGGDLILSANGQSLELPAEARPGPGLVLRDSLRELEPGASVALVIERDGRRQNLSVIAQRQESPRLPEFDIERFGSRGDLLLPRPPGEPLSLPLPPPGLFMGGPFGGPGFQLARLDEDLAGYFRTRDGVLVVKAPPPQDGAPALKSGDVIQAINGEPVGSPVEVLDRLLSLGPRAGVSLQVLRQGATLNLEGRLPELPAPGGFRHRS